MFVHRVSRLLFAIMIAFGMTVASLVVVGPALADYESGGVHYIPIWQFTVYNGAVGCWNHGEVWRNRPFIDFGPFPEDHVTFTVNGVPKTWNRTPYGDPTEVGIVWGQPGATYVVNAILDPGYAEDMTSPNPTKWPQQVTFPLFPDPVCGHAPTATLKQRAHRSVVVKVAFHGHGKANPKAVKITWRQRTGQLGIRYVKKSTRLVLHPKRHSVVRVKWHKRVLAHAKVM